MSNTTSSALTTTAQENFLSSSVDGLPSSTIRWAAGLQAHPEEEGTVWDNQALQPVTPPPRPIIPSLSTLEKAVSARIYFENLYFPLLRHPPSREQRRVAMETDMMNMKLSEAQKQNLRTRWRQNETDYLRDRRRKVDASAFIKLKTIGHGLHIFLYLGFILAKLIVRGYLLGAFGVVSLVKERPTGHLYAMKQVLFWNLACQYFL